MKWYFYKSCHFVAFDLTQAKRINCSTPYVTQMPFPCYNELIFLQNRSDLHKNVLIIILSHYFSFFPFASF